MLKRITYVVLGGAFASAALVGAEVVVAMRREYLPTEPRLVIEGVYGRGDPLRFVVLGDSTAAGLGTDEAHAYPTVLARRLSEVTGRRVELTGLGISGARVRDVLQSQVPEALSLNPDLIFVGIGANDATHLTNLDDVSRDMAEIIERLQTAGATVVIAGAPDMRAKIFWEPLRSIVGWRGRRVTAAITDAGLAAGVPVVPLAERTGPFFAADAEGHYAADDFHPSGLGYKRWADAIFPYLVQALR